MYQIHFFCTSENRFSVSLPSAGFSSCSRLRGTQAGRVYTRRKFGPRLGSVARVLGVHNRAIGQVITGLHFASPSLAGQ